MCTCTEDKEVIGNVIIGRNKVECDECKADRLAREAQKAKDDEIALNKEALAKSDYKILKKLEDMFLATDPDVLDRKAKRARINELEPIDIAPVVQEDQTEGV